MERSPWGLCAARCGVREPEQQAEPRHCGVGRGGRAAAGPSGGPAGMRGAQWGSHAADCLQCGVSGAPVGRRLAVPGSSPHHSALPALVLHAQLQLSRTPAGRRVCQPRGPGPARSPGLSQPPFFPRPPSP